MGSAPKRDAINDIDRYARTIVRSDMYLYGRLPGCFCGGLCEDVLQQVHVYLGEEFGDEYAQRVASAISAAPSMFKTTLEYEVLAKAIKKAIGQARWRYDQRRRRGLPQEVPFPEGYEELHFQESESVLIERTTDLLRMFNSWSPLELAVWQGSSLGKTVQELEQELGIDYRRVSEMRRRLQKDIESCLEVDLQKGIKRTRDKDSKRVKEKPI